MIVPYGGGARHGAQYIRRAPLFLLRGTALRRARTVFLSPLGRDLTMTCPQMNFLPGWCWWPYVMKASTRDVNRVRPEVGLGDFVLSAASFGTGGD